MAQSNAVNIPMDMVGRMSHQMATHFATEDAVTGAIETLTHLAQAGFRPNIQLFALTTQLARSQGVHVGFRRGAASIEMCFVS